MVAYGPVVVGGVGALKLVDLPHVISFSGHGLARAAFTEALWYWLFYIVLLALAYVSNPSDAHFRSFLTDLSFHRHLKQLHSKSYHLNNSSTTAHVLTFSNRIAISLRTPPYTRRDFMFFCAVYMNSPAVSDVGNCSQSNTCKSGSGLESGTCKDPSQAVEFFFGAFGHWWAWGPFGVDVSTAEQEHRLSSSVVAMESFDEQDEGKSITDHDGSPSESDYVPSEGKLPTHRTMIRSANPKVMPRVIRPGSKNRSGQVAVPTTLSDLRARAKTATAELVKTTSQQASTMTAKGPKSENFLSVHSQKHLPGLPFHVSTKKCPANVAPLPQNPPVVDSTELGDRLTCQLQIQYDNLHHSSQAVEKQLQGELEELRVRKREEDATRAHLRSRTRALEESKRQAEDEKLDAEKKLGSLLSTRDNVLARVDKVNRDISKLEAKGEEVAQALQQRVAGLKKEETQLQMDVESETSELARAEDALDNARVRRAQLQQRFEMRKQELSRLRECAVSRRSRLSMPNISLHHEIPSGFVLGTKTEFAGTEAVSIDAPRGGPLYLDSDVWRQTVLQPERSTTPPHGRPIIPPGGYLKHRRSPSLQYRSNGSSAFTADAKAPTISSTFAPFASPPATMPVNVAPNIAKAGTFYTEGPAQEQASRLMDGNLSPLTPHQTSLIPAQLFDLLDHEGDMNHGSLPPSPTPNRYFHRPFTGDLSSLDVTSTGLLNPRIDTKDLAAGPHVLNSMSRTMISQIPLSFGSTAGAGESGSPFISSTAAFGQGQGNMTSHASPRFESLYPPRQALNPTAKTFNYHPVRSTTPASIPCHLLKRELNATQLGGNIMTSSSPFDEFSTATKTTPVTLVRSVNGCQTAPRNIFGTLQLMDGVDHYDQHPKVAKPMMLIDSDVSVNRKQVSALYDSTKVVRSRSMLGGGHFGAIGGGSAISNATNTIASQQMRISDGEEVGSGRQGGVSGSSRMAALFSKERSKSLDIRRRPL